MTLSGNAKTVPIAQTGVLSCAVGTHCCVVCVLCAAFREVGFSQGLRLAPRGGLSRGRASGGRGQLGAGPAATPAATAQRRTSPL